MPHHIHPSQEEHYRRLAQRRKERAADEIRWHALTGELSETSPPPPLECQTDPQLGALWHELTGE